MISALDLSERPNAFPLRGRWPSEARSDEVENPCTASAGGASPSPTMTLSVFARRGRSRTARSERKKGHKKSPAKTGDARIRRSFFLFFGLPRRALREAPLRGGPHVIAVGATLAVARGHGTGTDRTGGDKPRPYGSLTTGHLPLITPGDSGRRRWRQRCRNTRQWSS